MPSPTARCCNATRVSPGSTGIPDIAPRVGFAWLDPMCGLMLAFIAAAAIWRRRTTGDAARIDFSMIEAMLWTLAEPLLAAQRGSPPVPRGNASDQHAAHGAWRCAGDDAWIAIANDTPIETEWLGECTARDAEARLLARGVAAAALASSVDLVASEHLRARGFWEAHGDGLLPGLPWRASFGRQSGTAPGLGADTDAVLAEVLGLSALEIARLRGAGALG